MKRVFFGVAVAAVALSASAFTSANLNPSRLTTAYITGYAPGTSQTKYTFSYDEVSDCSTGSVPCEVRTVGSYTLPVAPAALEIPVSDVIPGNLIVESEHNF